MFLICDKTRRRIIRIMITVGTVVLLGREWGFASDPMAERSEPGSVAAWTRMIEADWVEADRWFAATRTEPGQPVRVNTQGVTTVQDAAGAVDGVKNGRFGFHVAVGETDPWWQVDLGRNYRLDRIVVYNRTDGGLAPRTRRLRIEVARDDQPKSFTTIYQHDGTTFYGARIGRPLTVGWSGEHPSGRFVRLSVSGVCHLALDEVEVYGIDAPDVNVALGKPADQKSVGRHSVSAQAGAAQGRSPAADGGFQLAHTRDVVQRGLQLARRLRESSDPGQLDVLTLQLEDVDRRLVQLEQRADTSKKDRKLIYFTAQRLARKIAFSDKPAFGDLLFVKRRHPNYLHICDQYYGFTSRAGGGLYVLHDPFGDHPIVSNVLSHARVRNGRLRGRELKPGSFLSPELSFDGRKILFAYTENTDPEVSPAQAERNRSWTTTNCYHLFQVRADGTNLKQLTDGPWNDFDPCFLPSGRIAFISERRGGFVRCGTRACRSYNLCVMDSDGSHLKPLSRHDTNEWQPSVDNDGMLVYTRWDYIDRDTQAAHHLWTCYPDGRNPRAPHGNYPNRLSDRPWAEMDIRAIPGSRKFVAVAAPHHGHAFGSLIQIDLQVPDDYGSSQVTRLTPEVPFPEGEADIRSSMVYGTPWPLSEDEYLCAYDRGAKHHGIYWVDRFGNRQLLYRDPDIPCLSPIPLRSRTVPPNISSPTLADTTQADPTIDQPKANGRQAATISVANVYDGDFAWPSGTRIAQLRVLQILPKSVPRRNTPKVGVAEQSNARAVLGTVPVETDGSAYFEAPVDKLIYFQALDQQGRAVQSMRSATYVHAGEQLACQGCHEPNHRSPPISAGIPLAFRRKPSRLTPDVEGTNPFNYVRLVQPVFDRHCVACHEREGAVDLSGSVQYQRDRDGHQWPFTRSYLNLAEKHGFWFQTLINSLELPGLHGGSRVRPGRFGANAASLLSYLDPRHHGVQLSKRELHRITVWLDCNSEFLGAYEDAEAQARGVPVRPSLN